MKSVPCFNNQLVLNNLNFFYIVDIGDITEKAEERTIKGKKANVIVYTCPVLQLNRNIEKVTVDYEGELKEEKRTLLLTE